MTTPDRPPKNFPRMNMQTTNQTTATQPTQPTQLREDYERLDSVVGRYFVMDGRCWLPENDPEPAIVGPDCIAREVRYGELVRFLKSGMRFRMRRDAWEAFVELVENDPKEASTRFCWLADARVAGAYVPDEAITLGSVYVERPIASKALESIGLPGGCTQHPVTATTGA